MKINDHDYSPVGIFSRRNTVYNCTKRALLELPISGRDNCQSWCRELTDFRYRNIRHHRRPIGSRINRQQYESRKRDISRYIVTTNFLQGDRGIFRNLKNRRTDANFGYTFVTRSHIELKNFLVIEITVLRL